MRKLILFLCVLFCASLLMAGSSTVTYTAAQSTRIQTKLIPLFNSRHCQNFNLPTNCTTANLATAGCATVTVRTLAIETCVIFTSDATGEQAFLQEALNRQLVTQLGDVSAGDAAAFCVAFKAAATGTQNTICSNLGLASGCDPCV